MSHFDLEESLAECKIDFGCTLTTGPAPFYAKYYKIEINERIAFFVFFFNRLKELGKTKEDISVNKKTIIRLCIAKGKKHEDPRGGMYQACQTDLNTAIVEVFPLKTKQEVQIELDELSKKISAETVNDNQTSNKITDPDDPSYDWKNAPRWDPEKFYKEHPEESRIEDVLDPEMAELLGYNKKDE